MRHAQAAGPRAGREVGADPSLVCCSGVTAFSGPAGPASPKVTVPQLSPEPDPWHRLSECSSSSGWGGRVRGRCQQETTGLKSLDLKLGFSPAKLVLVHLS